MWIFGYGSLIWRPGFPFVAQVDGLLYGWKRYFYQGSTDHRGVPGSPGRVVTLLPEDDASCWGRLYKVESDTAASILAKLDHREKNGYERVRVKVMCVQDGEPTGEEIADVLLYIASAENSEFLGPAPLVEMAAQIALAQGPSGANRDYLLNLAASLREMGAHDAHVFALEKALLQRP